MELPPEMLKDLWRLREYCGEPSIIEQVRRAVSEYLQKKEVKIGTSIEDVSEAIAQHRQDWRLDLEKKFADRNRALSRRIY